MTFAACKGGGDDTGSGTGASTSTAAPETTGTAGTTQATDATSGGPSTTGPGTTGVTTGPGTTSAGTTTSSGTTSEDTATSAGTTGESTSTSEPGTTGEGSTTGGVGGGACQTDADCKLHDDCCSCYGIPKDQDDPICKKLCDQSMCDMIGIDQAVCRFGQCTTEKVQCSGEVACDALPPECPPGTLPGKTDACWTGACVPTLSCDAVEDCAQCPDGAMCVEYQSFVINRVCEPIPEACGGAPSCGCAGDLACTDPFDVCDDKGPNSDLACACPAC